MTNIMATVAAVALAANFCTNAPNTLWAKARRNTQLRGDQLVVSNDAETTEIRTNVVTRDEYEITAWESCACPDNVPGCCVLHSRPTASNLVRRVEVTTVVEIKTLTFKWDGEAYRIEHTNEVPRTARAWRLTWVEE